MIGTYINSPGKMLQTTGVATDCHKYYSKTDISVVKLMIANIWLLEHLYNVFDESFVSCTGQ